MLKADWHDQRGFDLLGETVEPPLGATRIERPAYERLRVEAGWPAMGAELTADTIPAEAGVVPVAASFTKGCYTGQELVARIDSRGGHVPHLLRHVRLDQPAKPGTAVEVDGKAVGRLTSVAGDLALAYVGRAVEPPAVCVARAPSRPSRAPGSRQLMPTYLDSIVAAHRVAAPRRAAVVGVAGRRRRRTCPPARGFRDAIATADGLAVIAEIKRRSPSKGDLNLDPRSGRPGHDLRGRRRRRACRC